MASGLPVDLTLNGEQLVNAFDGLDGDRRFLQLGEFVELATPVGPARRFEDRAGLAALDVKAVVTRVSIGLHDSAVTGEMLFRVFACTIGRVMEQRGGGGLAAETQIVPHGSPEPPPRAFPLRPHPYGRVLCVDTFRGANM